MERSPHTYWVPLVVVAIVASLLLGLRLLVGPPGAASDRPTNRSNGSGHHVREPELPRADKTPPDTQDTGSTIDLKVVRERTDECVEGASIIRFANGQATILGRTDAKGILRVASTDSPISLYVIDPHSFDIVVSVLAQPHSQGPLVASLPQPTEIGGVILDAETGAPIGDATAFLALECDLPREVRQMAFGNLDGTRIPAVRGEYRFSGLASIDSRGAAKARMIVFRAPEHECKTTEVCASGTTAVRLDVRLRRLPRALSPFNGRILDDSGEPLRDATVVLRYECIGTNGSRLSQYSEAEITGEDGSFTIEMGCFRRWLGQDESAQQQWRLAVSAEGTPGTDMAIGSVLTGVEVRMTRGVDIHGSVRDASGDPLAGSKVEFFLLAKGAEPVSNRPVITVQTDERGAFVCPVDPTKRYCIVAHAPETGESDVGHGVLRDYESSMGVVVIDVR